jgi:hypothetical protein
MIIPSARTGLGVAIMIKTNKRIEMRDNRFFFMTLSLSDKHTNLLFMRLERLRTMKGSRKSFDRSIVAMKINLFVNDLPV